MIKMKNKIENYLSGYLNEVSDNVIFKKGQITDKEKTIIQKEELRDFFIKLKRISNLNKDYLSCRRENTFIYEDETSLIYKENDYKNKLFISNFNYNSKNKFVTDHVLDVILDEIDKYSRTMAKAYKLWSASQRASVYENSKIVIYEDIYNWLVGVKFPMKYHILQKPLNLKNKIKLIYQKTKGGHNEYI
jgi:hypothetical protein